LKLKRTTGKPIIAKLSKAVEGMEENI